MGNSSRWNVPAGIDTGEQLKKWLNDGSPKGISVHSGSMPGKTIQFKSKSASEKEEGINKIKAAMTTIGLTFRTEYKFCEGRRFKFDIAFPEQKIAVEYEGIFSDKSGHTTLGGYIKDCVKYRMAVMQGWMVLRYTSNCVSGPNGEFIPAYDVRELINKRI